MGVRYFLVCVRSYESNLSTNICTTVGRKHNDIGKSAAFWVKPRSCLILWQHSMFSFTKVCIILPMVFIMFFIATCTVCSYDFCKTVLVKKYTPCQGMIWFSLSNVTSFTLAFMWEFNYTIEAPLRLRKHEKTALGHCPRTPAGAYAPQALRARVLKKWPPSQLVFAVRTSPKAETNLHRLFNMSSINTNFDMFFKN